MRGWSRRRPPQARSMSSRQRLDRPIKLVDADPRWPRQFELLGDDIRRALGDSALAVEHVGSTSVPGLLAKPILDICLVVEEPAVEGTYVPMLRTIGYVLELREPAWYEHRMLWHDHPASHLHVFGAHCVEVERMIHLRDHLRSHPESREDYARTKQELASRRWPTGRTTQTPSRRSSKESSARRVSACR
jgi:GrpB-like predicted nucleotidyltransferase (UPF0157 family)